VHATEFLGYAQDEGAASLVAIVKDGHEVNEVKSGEAQLIFNQSPFYGESGGQMGDAGVVKMGDAIVAEITDTQKPIDDLHVHKAIVKAPLKVGDTVTLHIDAARRARIRANHSATHILHAVLRRQLGDHITQKGSLVAPDKLRFDISHPKAMTREEIASAEAEVNRVIWQNAPVHTRLMTPDEAVKHGAMALFGEKYGDEVRVVSMGTRHEAIGTSDHASSLMPHAYSIELCGGTHVSATGDIGLFKILSESAVAAGIRRIEAVTRDGAFEYLAQQDARVRDIGTQLKANPAELESKIAALMNERKKLEKELGEAKKSLAMGGGGGSAAVEVETIGGMSFIGKIFDGLDPKELRGVAEGYLKQAEVVVAATHTEGKASLVVAVGKTLLDKINAIDLVKAAVEVVGGKGGGGRPEMAQGGGPDAGKLEEALEAIKKRLTIPAF